jgi:hypothetical protein
MRIAVKYSMDDIQVAIVKVIQLFSRVPLQNLKTAILLLAFVAEFPSYFTNDFAIKVFTDASSIQYRPTADDLEPLMAYPAFVALMMKYREGLSTSMVAIWSEFGLNREAKGVVERTMCVLGIGAREAT